MHPSVTGCNQMTLNATLRTALGGASREPVADKRHQFWASVERVPTSMRSDSLASRAQLGRVAKTIEAATLLLGQPGVVPIVGAEEPGECVDVTEVFRPCGR